MSYNRFIIWLLQSPIHALMSGNTLLIGFSGRKTGKRYIVPVNYVLISGDGGDRLFITSERGRTWWRNLRDGAPVDVYLKGVELKARTRVLEDPDDVERGLMTYLSRTPGTARYFDVALDDRGAPRGEDVVRAAQKRVMIEVDLSSI